MIRAPLTDAIVEVFDTLPSQLQDAARYLLDNPEDVALLSMREQARRAGLQPWTMVRLAKRLGFDGYEPLRSLYANAMRQGELGFAGKAGTQLARQKEVGDRALAAEMVRSLSEQVAQLGEPERLDALIAAAERLHAARRIFCLGLRSSHPVVAHFAYVMSFLGEKAVMLDGASGTGTDAIRLAAAEDVLFAVSVAPYTRLTVDLARRAAANGVPVIALTDSAVSPLAGLAGLSVLVPTESPSFFHAMSPAFVVGEILAALIAGKGGEKALAAIRRTEDQLSQFDIHILPPRGRRKA
ncbi:MurR/RpiR family transcriptional regulator [Mesorhizobium sp. VK23B]|uniref:MurR/RpiR family transcriptional regulator n=1 Tax=Mesorhizobium dulcispinae TaxID=3072316 RepID=A0ABU4XPC3_9HYPH|nr:MULTISPECIES: MurR/RpiR family transcriptional regulator [unclassified Mesorhizobium]MDX8470093.1 MurR/RpiR family transcriptional regulator [Mesorhizobium sp. VK23B]MDX8476433.1 MurR/RpiR family transcriptional regulator [Mesorhizobium sp. VK23A]